MLKIRLLDVETYQESLPYDHMVGMVHQISRTEALGVHARGQRSAPLGNAYRSLNEYIFPEIHVWHPHVQVVHPRPDIRPSRLAYGLVQEPCWQT